jgi:predicted ATPase
MLLSASYELMGSILFHQGEFLLARSHLERALASYDPRQHYVYMLLYGHDPGVFGAFYLAWGLWYLGYPEQAISKTENALALARQLGSPYILSAALNMTITVRESCLETAVVPILLQENQQLCREHGFSLQASIAALQQTWLLTHQGRLEEGIPLMRQSLATWQAMGDALMAPYHLGLLAKAYGKAGQTEEGLSVLAEALDGVGETGERFYEAELYRLKGALTLQSKVPSPRSKVEAEAEGCFLKAIEIARRQQAKSLELRAVMSLSRLWRQQGKKRQARRMLAEIYGWFTEGFDTKDLKEAKTLLEKLS